MRIGVEFSNWFSKLIKVDYLMIILGYFFFFFFFLCLYKNICCGYEIEAPWWGTSNEYPQHIFFIEKWRKLPQNYHQVIRYLLESEAVEYILYSSTIIYNSFLLRLCLWALLLLLPRKKLTHGEVSQPASDVNWWGNLVRNSWVYRSFPSHCIYL